MGHGEKTTRNAVIPSQGKNLVLRADQKKIAKSTRERAGLMRIAMAVPMPTRTNRWLLRSREGATASAAVRIRAERHVSQM
jgi:hypothetical protein